MRCATGRGRSRTSPPQRARTRRRCTGCCGRSPRWVSSARSRRPPLRAHAPRRGPALGRPEAAAGRAVLIGQPSYWQAWGHLLHSVRTGENAFRARPRRSTSGSYRAPAPGGGRGFDRGDDRPLPRASNRALVEAYDFGRFGTRGRRRRRAGRPPRRAPGPAPAPARRALRPAPRRRRRRGGLQAGRGGRSRARSSGELLRPPCRRAGTPTCSSGSSTTGRTRRPIADPARLPALRARRTAPSSLIERVLADEGRQSPEAAFSDLNMLVAPGGRSAPRTSSRRSSTRRACGSAGSCPPAAA